MAQWLGQAWFKCHDRREFFPLCSVPLLRVSCRKNTVLCWFVITVYNVAPHNYRIQPNYCTVRLGFSNLQDTLICGQICIYLLRIHYKKDQKRTYLMMTMRFFLTLYKGICCGYSFELHRLVDAIQMSTHNICLCKEKSTLVVI